MALWDERPLKGSMGINVKLLALDLWSKKCIILYLDKSVKGICLKVSLFPSPVSHLQIMHFLSLPLPLPSSHPYSPPLNPSPHYSPPPCWLTVCPPSPSPFLPPFLSLSLPLSPSLPPPWISSSLNYQVYLSVACPLNPWPVFISVLGREPSSSS